MDAFVEALLASFASNTARDRIGRGALEASQMAIDGGTLTLEDEAAAEDNDRMEVAEQCAYDRHVYKKLGSGRKRGRRWTRSTHQA